VLRDTAVLPTMFVPLPPTDGPPAGRVGCLLMLATVLLLLGGGIVAVFSSTPPARATCG